MTDALSYEEIDLLLKFEFTNDERYREQANALARRRVRRPMSDELPEHYRVELDG